jgi:hypothetical protein
MVRKADLIALLEVAQEEILRFRSTFSQDERNLSGTVDQWMPRDILAHIGERQRRLAGRIARSRSGEAVQHPAGIPEENDQIFEMYSSEPWEAILAVVEAGHRELVAQIEALHEEELNTPHLFPWLGDRPLWRFIYGVVFSHAMTHLTLGYLERRDHASAERVREIEAREAARLDPSPEWQGTIRYNLACHYALSGEREKALDKLKTALHLNPALVEHSRQDDDLRSLHHDPAFLALLENYRT